LPIDKGLAQKIMFLPRHNKSFVEMWKFSLVAKKFNEENIEVLPIDENLTKKQKGFVERQRFNHEEI
jgi:peroxiredoxin